MRSAARDHVMNKTCRIAYWLTTTLVAAELALGGVWDLLRTPYVRSVIEHLGYPSYFLVIIGAWKVPGALALVVPRFPRLKEWAYAGAFFTYAGAIASHLVVGDGPEKWAAPLVFAGLTGTSWALRPASWRELITGPASASRARTLAYWIVTGIIATECIVGGIMGGLHMPPFIGIIRHLGYPAYFMTILGVWYVLAGVVLLAPRFPRLEEWAYAGLVFNYTGAAASHLAAGDGASTLIAPVVFMGLTLASWALRPPSRIALVL
jgi:uncharacterized membrane protein YphA (DoxX/SURF4 family)